MARKKNDGRGRLGGRAKGTPNKATTDLREWIRSLIDDNRDQIEEDLNALEPKERLQFIEKLLKYVVPNTPVMQTTTATTNLLGELRFGFTEDDYDEEDQLWIAEEQKSR